MNCSTTAARSSGRRGGRRAPRRPRPRRAGGLPVAMATVTRPVMRMVRITMMYTPPEHRHNGYAIAVTLAVSHAELARRASEVVLITDSNRPHRQAAQLGYELIGERAVLRFGPATGSIPRLPTGPLPRLRSR